MLYVLCLMSYALCLMVYLDTSMMGKENTPAPSQLLQVQLSTPDIGSNCT
jgi:hypothetical protein